MSRVLQLNCQGAFRYKVFEIIECLKESGGVIAAISETHLCEESCTRAHTCAEVSNIAERHWRGRPRNIHGGGVGFLIKKSVKFIHRQDLRTPEVEDEWIEIVGDGKPSIFVCSVYIPPNSVAGMMAFRQNLATVTSENERVIVLGDFNARCISLGDEVNNALARHFEDLIDETKLQVCNEPEVATRKGSRGEHDSILDITLVSLRLETEVMEWGVYEQFSSDHLGVSFKIHLPGMGLPPSKKRLIWCFKEADWEKYRELLSKELRRWRDNAEWQGELDLLYKRFSRIILESAARTIPKKWLSDNVGPKMSQKVRELRRERKRAVKIKKRVDSEMIRQRISVLGRKISSEIRREGERKVEEILEIPRGAREWDMWKKYKKVTKGSKKRMGVMEIGGRKIFEDATKAEVMNEFFSELGVDREEDTFDDAHRHEVNRYVSNFDFGEECKAATNELFTECEVERGVSELNAYKTTGPDKVHNRFLMEGGSEVVLSLLQLFNESWKRGQLPKEWKKAEIVPIPKHSGTTKVEKLRPISLISVVGKLMDKLVARRIAERGEREGWFPSWQGGFRAGRGVSDQLVCFSHTVTDAWRRRRHCITAFLDASKAYDRVCRNGLIMKLIKLGVRGRLLRWIVDFISKRMGRVRCNGEQSEYREYRYGLPQGSCLSPILFNVFFSDMFPSVIADKDIRVAVYADDICITVIGDTMDETAQKLSGVLDTVDLWGKKNRVRFDKLSDKCGYMIFSRRASPDQRVRFGDQQLTRQFRHKYLGVIFDQSLTFSDHLSLVKAKAWAGYHAVRRVVGNNWGATTRTVVKLYEGLVRPILEAACVVWDGASNAVKVVLERVHRLSLLAATGANSRTSTVELELYCNTQSLQDRRDFLVATFYRRVQRLDPRQHPIATMFREWQASGSPSFGPRASLLPRGAALCRRLCRFSGFDDSDAKFFEPIPSPPIRVHARYEWRQHDKERARAKHIKLVNRLSRDDVVVYTDGSAVPNPGKIGLGVSACFGGQTTTYGTPIGIGSNITAELCAISSALEHILSIDGLQNFNRVFIFSDCQNAIDLALNRCTATHSFELVRKIHSNLDHLKAIIQLVILWVPAHVGVPGNEAANTAAQNAANMVQQTSPMQHQPLIPLSTSRAFIKRSQKIQLQQRWFSVVAAKGGAEHLSRLRACVSASPAFFLGTRKQQTILARLRFGSNNLNASKSRWFPNVSEQCECGAVETVRHFLLHCPRYDQPRSDMISKVRTFWQGIVNEDVLLGGGGVRLPEAHWELVIAAVAKFVQSTNRYV